MSVRARLARVALACLAACGTDPAPESPAPADAPPAPVCDEAVPPDGAALPEVLPNTSRHAASVAVRVRRTSLAPGGVLVPEVSLAVPRFVGSQVSVRSLAELGTLGPSVAVSVRAFAARGLRLKLLRLTESGLVPVPSFDAAAPGGVGPDAVFPAASEGGWTTLSVSVPVDRIALSPAKGDRGDNVFAVGVDEVTPEACDPTVAVRELAVTVTAQAPLVLVHGVNDFQEQAFGPLAELLRRAGLVADLDVDFSGLSDKSNGEGKHPGYNGSVADDVARIEERLLRLEHDYGTRDVHLVAHSKGGLDLVNFLAKRYPALKAARKLRVLSLQTLATPHGGSVNADIVAPLTAWAKAQGYTGLQDLATWGIALTPDTDAKVFDSVALTGLQGAVVTGAGPIEPALSDLRTDSEAVRIDQGWEGDPSIAFATYAWDADFERDGWYNDLGQKAPPPAPGDLFSKYSTDCRGIPTGSAYWSRYCIDRDEADIFFGSSQICTTVELCGAPAWRLMAHGARATVVSEKQTIGSRSTLRVEPYGPGVWLGNDLTVSVASAAHPKASQNFVLAGAAPREISGLRRVDDEGRVSPYTARCAHTGGNHLSLLHHGKADMVECTAGDVIRWIAERVPLVSGR